MWQVLSFLTTNTLKKLKWQLGLVLDELACYVQLCWDEHFRFWTVMCITSWPDHPRDSSFHFKCWLSLVKPEPVAQSVWPIPRGWGGSGEEPEGYDCWCWCWCWWDHDASLMNQPLLMSGFKGQNARTEKTIRTAMLVEACTYTVRLYCVAVLPMGS